MKSIPLGPNWKTQHIRAGMGSWGLDRPINLIRPMCLEHSMTMCRICEPPREIIKKCLILQKMLFEFQV